MFFTALQSLRRKRRFEGNSSFISGWALKVNKYFENHPRTGPKLDISKPDKSEYIKLCAFEYVDIYAYEDHPLKVEIYRTPPNKNRVKTDKKFLALVLFCTWKSRHAAAVEVSSSQSKFADNADNFFEVFAICHQNITKTCEVRKSIF